MTFWSCVNPKSRHFWGIWSPCMTENENTYSQKLYTVNLQLSISVCNKSHQNEATSEYLLCSCDQLSCISVGFSSSLHLPEHILYITYTDSKHVSVAFHTVALDMYIRTIQSHYRLYYRTSAQIAKRSSLCVNIKNHLAAV